MLTEFNAIFNNKVEQLSDEELRVTCVELSFDLRAFLRSLNSDFIGESLLHLSEVA